MKDEKRGLVSVGNLFDRYKRVLKPPQRVVTEAFCEVVEDLFSVKIPLERVTYKTHSKVLSVAVSGVLKGEIKVREEEILTHLRGRLGAGNAPRTIV